MSITGGNGQSSMIPVFKGDNYDVWRIKMKTLFRSQELWEVVESGFAEDERDEAKLRENRKRDAKALFFIQQGMDETDFTGYLMHRQQSRHGIR